MLVLMMFIVDMNMLMHNKLVSVQMAVAFAHHDRYACHHHGCAEEIWPCWKLAE